MGLVHNPHDNFFKTSMSNKQVARNFFEEHLPADIKKQLDLDTLELQPGNFVDKALQQSESDMLFKVKFRDKCDWAFVYILAEHQSSVDELMPFRLWQYIIAIWNEYLKKNKAGKLPLVIPLVFYNGQKRYDGPRDIRELIEAPSDLIEYFLFKPFHLIDTHDISDENLRHQHWSGLMEFAMKHAFAKEAMHLLKHLIPLMKDIIADPGSNDYLVTVLKYILNQVETADPEKLRETIAVELSEPKEGKIMATLANYLREQGAKEGQAHFLMNILKAKFNDLSDTYLEKISSADTDALNKWGINVLNAQSLDEVFV